MEFMDGPSPSMLEEASIGKRRLRRSCEACRNSKGKCVPSEQTGQCQRCLKDGHPCIFEAAKPRPKRAKNSRLRVAEMEEKLDGLMALLAARQTGKEASPSESPSAPSQPTTIPSPPAIELQAFTHPVSSSVSSISFSRSDVSKPQSLMPVFSFPSFDSFNDAISKGIVTYSQAEAALPYFQSRAPNFPFVLLPPKITVDALRRERPFLLLAILTFATNRNERLQNRLELELRETLSKKILVHCEKSIDLLQGLLVYLAWYQYYFEPDREQMYQLSQMAAAMAVDLGIHKQTQVTGPSDVRVVKARLFFPNSPEELEAQRTFLGCYYITTSICQGLRKPNTLKYCDYMETCAQSLVQAAVAETDSLLPYFIRLQRLAEEIEYAFDYGQNEKLPPLDTLRIEILLKSFEQQLSQFEIIFPQRVWNNISLTLKFYNLRVYINEIGLHVVRPGMEVVPSSSWYFAASRNESLIRCLQATKDYLDRYLLLGSDDLTSLNMTDFIPMVYAILVLGAFAAGAYNSPSLDATSIRQTANLEYYLDALSTQALQILALSPPGSNNYISHVYDLYQQSKIWYQQLARDPPPIGNAGRPTFSFMEIIPTIMARCVDFSEKFGSSISEVSSGVESRMSEVGSDVQWSEMLSNWAANQDLSNMVLDTTLG